MSATSKYSQQYPDICGTEGLIKRVMAKCLAHGLLPYINEFTPLLKGLIFPPREIFTYVKVHKSLPTLHTLIWSNLYRPIAKGYL